MDFAQNRIYTVDDIYALPEGVRAELIDGVIYDMASPNRRHQELVGELFAEDISSFIYPEFSVNISKFDD